MDVIFVNGTKEEFVSLLKQAIKEVIEENDSKKVAPLQIKEACEQLGVSFPTMKKIMKEMNLDVIFPADIDHILFK